MKFINPGNGNIAELSEQIGLRYGFIKLESTKINIRNTMIETKQINFFERKLENQYGK